MYVARGHWKTIKLTVSVPRSYTHTHTQTAVTTQLLIEKFLSNYVHLCHQHQDRSSSLLLALRSFSHSLHRLQTIHGAIPEWQCTQSHTHTHSHILSECIVSSLIGVPHITCRSLRQSAPIVAATAVSHPLTGHCSPALRREWWSLIACITSTIAPPGSTRWGKALARRSPPAALNKRGRWMQLTDD